MGLLAPIASFFSGVLSSFDANGVSVRLGAIQLIRAFGAHSDAMARVKPSIAPLDVLTVAWNGIPRWTATVENNTHEGIVSLLKFFCAACRALMAPITCN